MHALYFRVFIGNTSLKSTERVLRISTVSQNKEVISPKHYHISPSGMLHGKTGFKDISNTFSFGTKGFFNGEYLKRPFYRKRTEFARNKIDMLNFPFNNCIPKLELYLVKRHFEKGLGS